MKEQGETFLGRWARRKAEAKEGVKDEPVVPREIATSRAPHPSPLPGAEKDPATLAPLESGRGEATGPLSRSAAEEAPLPTLADVAALTRDSDYSRFVAAGVDEGVKRAALKKLFSDPHFNIMDGLDTYIEDYNTPDPIPPSMLRKMWQSKALGLFDDEDEKKPQASPDGATLAAVPQSATEAAGQAPAPAVPPDEDTDLRLQPDDDAGRPGAGEGARPGEV